MTTPESIPLGLDLEQQARYHIDFLARVEGVPELKQYAVLWRALYRYEKFWLPLAAEHSDEILSAPLDIEWIWHCHLLAPIIYAKDCMVIANTIVDHKLRSQEEYNDAVERSRTYWQQKYGDIDSAPFDVDYDEPSVPPVPNDFQTKVTYKVIEAANRQKVFYYQVSLPHYKDDRFLKGSELRYRKFLFLKTHFPKSFSVPCFEQDLMWHTHQLNPLIYREDTKALLGHVFNHDDTVNDRSEGSRLNNCAAETTAQWLELFNEPYTWPGAMYRGQPPGGILYKLTENEIKTASTKTSEVALKSLTLKLSDAHTLKPFCDASVSAYGCAGTRVAGKWFSLRTKQVHKHIDKQNRESEANVEYETNEETFTFSTRTMNSVRIDFETKTGILGRFTKPRKPISFKTTEILSAIENCCGVNKRMVEISDELEDGAELCLNCSISEPVRGSMLLFLLPSEEEVLELPANVQSVLGPVALERIPSGADHSCRVTSIRLKNHVGAIDFTSKFMYLPSMVYSVVQIFHRDHMIAVAHPIGCEQLPAPSQVDDDIITLDHGLGERAVVIKNHQGDWVILKGHLETRKGDNSSGNSDNGDPSKLSLFLYKMSDGSIQRTSVDLDLSHSGVRLDATRVDLAKGVIEIDTDTGEVGERIALAFCVSMLKKMLVPRKKT